MSQTRQTKPARQPARQPAHLFMHWAACRVALGLELLLSLGGATRRLLRLRRPPPLLPLGSLLQSTDVDLVQAQVLGQPATKGETGGDYRAIDRM